MALLHWIVLSALYSLGVALTSPPSGALVVRQTGTQAGEYKTIGAAVATLGSGNSSKTIFIYPGTVVTRTYKEQVNLTYGGPLTIYGYATKQVTITNNLNAKENGGNDACATVRAEKPNLNLYNLNIANTYGAGSQATALSARATRQAFYGLYVTGYQDTLFADAHPGYQYYSRSLIEGAIDYIYGAASAWFNECTISNNGAGGAITANSREDPDDAGYYVIDSSNVTTSVSGLKGQIYLGRPWRVLARVVYQRSVLGDSINPKGWTTMAEGATPIFMEFNNTGAGANTSQRQMTTTQTALITREQVLGLDWQSWVDASF